MTHQESTVKIYFTTDYGRFLIINGNRPIDENRVKTIKTDIESGIDVLKYYPIQVYERAGRLEIDDGQHRFYVAKLLKRSVHYIIMSEERTLHEIAKINSNVGKWKTRDFINCYVQQDNKHYKELEEFMTVYELSATLSVKLLSTGDPGTGGSNLISFQTGLFKVEKKAEAVKLTEACRNFKDFNHWRSNLFFTAIKRIMEAGKITIPDLVAKYNQNPELLIKQPDAKSYIGILSIIYNKRRNTIHEII